MVLVQLLFQTYYSLVYLVKYKKVLSGGVIMGQEIEYKINIVKWEGMDSKSVSG